MAAETVNEVLAVANITADPAPAVSMVSYFCDSTAGGFFVTVPDVASVTDGVQIRVTLSVGSNQVRVTTVGGTDLIGTATIQNITQAGTGITIQANAGAGKWEIIQDSRGGVEKSIGGNESADAGKVLEFNTEGQIQGSSDSSSLAAVKGTASGSGYGVHGESATGTGVVGQSTSGNGVDAASNTARAVSAINFAAAVAPVIVKNANVANTASLAHFHRNDNLGLEIKNDGSLSWDTATGASATRTALGLGTLATQSGTFSGTSSGTNTGDQTNIAGNAATVTTNANLTGPVTSVGNATAIADGALSIAKTSGLQTALDAKADKAISIRTYTGTTDTLVLGDAGNMVRGNNAGANTCTIPLNAVVAFPIGTQILFVQRGAGQMSIAITGGGTLNSYGGALKLVGQYAQALATKVDTDEWSIDGNLTT